MKKSSRGFKLTIPIKEEKRGPESLRSHQYLLMIIAAQEDSEDILEAFNHARITR